MQISLIVLTTFLISLSSFAGNWKDHQLVNGCKIYSQGGYLIRTFPGGICVFLDNGNFISANDNAIRMINPKNEPVWEFQGHFHHQINLSSDKTKIYSLSSEILGGLREDIFFIFDLNGKVLFQQKASELYRQAGQKPINWKISPFKLNNETTSVEYSHFNSFYDVPSQTGKNNPSWLKEGNIILNSSESGIFILSPDMSQVLHHELLSGSIHHRVHDVQIKQNGNFLLFNNLVANVKPHPFFITGPKPTSNFSAIQEIHPVTKAIVQEFTANPKTIFYSWICGSVQELDSDTWLFTHFLAGTYIYSKSKKDFVVSIPGTHADNQRFGPVQQVKAQDLSKFLSYWP